MSYQSPETLLKDQYRMTPWQIQGQRSQALICAGYIRVATGSMHRIAGLLMYSSIAASLPIGNTVAGALIKS
jgi:hypothetical protein